MTDPIVVGMAFVLGSIIGSFLNVCIVRWPADQSVIRPSSHCPGCGRDVKWYDNIPLLSWIVLRGRCRHCRAPISPMYILVELGTAVMFAAIVWAWGLSLMTGTAALFGTLLMGIAVTDARHYIIPNEYTVGGLVMGLALSLVKGWQGFAEALLGAAVGFTVLWVVGVIGTWIFKEDAMGGGDIKMMAMVGAFLGWKGVLLTIFLGALVGSVIFVPLTLRKKRLVPFGVFLAIGAASTFVVGDAIMEWYLQFVQAG